MKTPLLYGSVIAIVNALATFAFFFAGLHDTMEKLKTAQNIGLVIAILVYVVGLSLAMRERRTDYPTDRDWTYGSAFVTGMLTGLVAAVIGCIVSFVYFAIVNPQFTDLAFQSWQAQAEAKGASASQIEAASGVMHKIFSPVGLIIGGFLYSGFFGALIFPLIVAIFFRRRPETTSPMEATPPPAA